MSIVLASGAAALAIDNGVCCKNDTRRYLPRIFALQMLCSWQRHLKWDGYVVVNAAAAL
jgi:hypothetical protein